MAWQQFVMHLDSLDPDRVEDAFLQLGAASVTLTDAGDNPVLEPAPGETPLWADTSITGLFTDDTDLTAFRRDLAGALDLASLPRHRIEDLEDRDWEREWMKDFGPMQFGSRTWIVPKGSEPFSRTGSDPVPEKGSDPVTEPAIILLDPGLAFGTGTHATTALCLEWLDSATLDGESMLDYGCGSGVLAIAALKLGCTSAVAMDIDPQAVTATRQNADKNGVGERLSVVGSAEEIDGKFGVVLANILARPLIESAESITSTLRQGGMLTLSGVLCEQAGEVMAAYEPWIEFSDPVFREQDGQIWSKLTGQRRADP